MRAQFLLPVFTLVFLSLNVAGQSNFRFGLHISPNISYVSTNDDAAETGSKLLFGYGGIVEYEFSENYSLASGFDILNRGGTLEKDGTVSEYRSGFLQFPIMLKMRTREFGYFTFFGEFGLVPAFKTADNVEFRPEIPEAERLDSYVNTFNTVFRFGLGAEYDLGGSSAILAGINYNRSLFDNIRDDDPRLSSQNTYRFDYIALTLGFLF